MSTINNVNAFDPSWKNR